MQAKKHFIFFILKIASARPHKSDTSNGITELCSLSFLVYQRIASAFAQS